jgi:hypothetical protein
MSKRAQHVALALLFAGALLPVMATTPDTQVLKGYVTDTWCGVNRSKKPPTAECTRECVADRHAQYAFYNFADKKVYVLNPQNLAKNYAGRRVVVTGTVGDPVKFETVDGPARGAVITASSISLAK